MEKNSGYRVKLSLGRKFCYGIGDIGEGMSNGFVAMFFLIFCTDTFGINAGVVDTLLLLGRFWDMINDTWVGPRPTVPEADGEDTGHGLYLQLYR